MNKQQMKESKANCPECQDESLEALIAEEKRRILVFLNASVMFLVPTQEDKEALAEGLANHLVRNRVQVGQGTRQLLVEALRSVMRQAQLFDAFRDDVGQVVLEGANAALKAEKEDSSNG